MDIAIYESGNGGDAKVKGNDLELTESLFNSVYIAWFGGNPGASTTGRELPNEQRFDWWGNSLLFPNDKEIQFNSELENALNTLPLTSATRTEFEKIAKKDLDFLTTFAEVKTSVSILNDNKIQIDAFLQEPNNLDDKKFRFIWDATKKELIEKIIL
jgi:hypothetical protein